MGSDSVGNQLALLYVRESMSEYLWKVVGRLKWVTPRAEKYRANETALSLVPRLGTNGAPDASSSSYVVTSPNINAHKRMYLQAKKPQQAAEVLPYAS